MNSRADPRPNELRSHCQSSAEFYGMRGFEGITGPKDMQ